MKSTEVCDVQTAHALRLDWLDAQLLPASEYGTEAYEAVVPFASGSELAAQTRAKQIFALSRALAEDTMDALREGLAELADISEILARLSLDDSLEDAQFYDLQRFCDAVVRLATLHAAFPHVCLCKNILGILEPGRAGRFGFYLADAFSEELAQARARAHAAQAEYDTASGRMRSAVAQVLGRAEIPADEFIVMRDEVTGTLPPGIHVKREAPSYFLCELAADETTLEAMERRDAAAARVAATEQETRAMISAQLGAHGAGLRELLDWIAQFDVDVAAARFTKRFDCRPAQYVSEMRANLSDARFAPVQADLDQLGRPYTAIDIELNPTAVLTGPNMGGKSVALQTLGFIAVCAAFGLPVPAKKARLPLFSRIAWMGIGTGEQLMGSMLSSYASEVIRAREVLADPREPALLLFDEFARTTTPDESRALLLAIMEMLARRRVCSFIATHLSGVGGLNGAAHFAVRGLREAPVALGKSDLLDVLAALGNAMDYRIERVQGGRSQGAGALELARLLGLDDALVARAHSLLHQGEHEPTRRQP